MKKWNKIVLLGWVLLIGLAVSLVYNVVDNRRFRIEETTIVIERLPPAFDGFRILQISDLHGRYFGEKQARLIQAVNNLPYDMIALTGDMNNSRIKGDTVENSSAILDLLDGIEDKEYLFWVDGNVGPYAIESYCGGANTGDLTPIGSVLQEKGVRVLIQPDAIQRGYEKIWITPALSKLSMEGAYRSLSGDAACWGSPENYERVQAHYQEVDAVFQAIDGNDEVKILLAHNPRQTNLSEVEMAQMGEMKSDLILAGHYHGGQWRLPLIGAVYIPSPTDGINNSGLFPAQSAVKGWSISGGTPQYVSAGLGASGHQVWTDFRLFNTPEINLITLRVR